MIITPNFVLKGVMLNSSCMFELLVGQPVSQMPTPKVGILNYLKGSGKSP